MSRSKRDQLTRNPDARKGVIVRTGMLLAQCLGLAVACAKGEQLDSGPVQRITLPNPDASMPHDSGDQGSGGRMGTSGGTGVVTGSGGAPLGSGGSSAGGSSPGKGGSSGASTGGAVSSGGAKATGGALATGGTASGGAPASGGSASGGRASGGASGDGGKATGGSVGAGGGSGGAQACPGYSDHDACSHCICQKCATQVDACFNSSDTTKNAQCKAIQDCAESKHCASGPCYCTQPPTDPFCLNPDGPCVAPILAVAGQGASALTVQQLGNDSTNPIGRANNIGKCSSTNCKTECQLP